MQVTVVVEAMETIFTTGTASKNEFIYYYDFKSKISDPTSLFTT